MAYLVIDNGRPAHVFQTLDGAKRFARVNAKSTNVNFWRDGIYAETDRLLTTSENGCKRWTGWEVRPIGVELSNVPTSTVDAQKYA